MNQPMTAHIDGWTSVEPSLRGQIESRLDVGEHIQAWMMSDIDDQRKYRTTLLALSDRRMFSADGQVRDWTLTEIDKLRTKDRGGLGTLELLGVIALTSGSLAASASPIQRANWRNGSGSTSAASSDARRYSWRRLARSIVNRCRRGGPDAGILAPGQRRSCALRRPAGERTRKSRRVAPLAGTRDRVRLGPARRSGAGASSHFRGPSNAGRRAPARGCGHLVPVTRDSHTPGMRERARRGDAPGRAQARNVATAANTASRCTRATATAMRDFSYENPACAQRKCGIVAADGAGSHDRRAASV